jgi:hypothetical protein
MRQPVAIALLTLALTGCVTDRQTDTARTATEELIVSAAADRAAEALSEKLPTGGKMYLDATNFDAVDSKYAIGAIRDALLRHGDKLLAKADGADMVVELRSGALGTDDHELLVGIPGFNVPIPLAGSFGFPKIALYDRTTQEGVAKFGATAIDPKTGALIASSPPQFGYSHKVNRIVMLFFAWQRQDIIPPDQKDTYFDKGQ